MFITSDTTEKDKEISSSSSTSSSSKVEGEGVYTPSMAPSLTSSALLAASPPSPALKFSPKRQVAESTTPPVIGIVNRKDSTTRNSTGRHSTSQWTSRFSMGNEKASTSVRLRQARRKQSVTAHQILMKRVLPGIDIQELTMLAAEMDEGLREEVEQFAAYLNTGRRSSLSLKHISLADKDRNDLPTRLACGDDRDDVSTNGSSSVNGDRDYLQLTPGDDETSTPETSLILSIESPASPGAQPVSPHSPLILSIPIVHDLKNEELLNES